MEEDLLNKYLEETGGTVDYLNPIPPNEIRMARLLNIYDRINIEGTFLVTSHYGTLANAVNGEPAPKEEITEEAVKIIHRGLVKLLADMSIHGDEVNKFSPGEMVGFRRTLAIMVFLVHRTLSGLEAKSVQTILSASGGGKKGKKVVVQAGSINWNNYRFQIIEDVLAIMELPVEKIWEDSGYGFSVPRILIRTMCSNLNEPYLAPDNLRAGNDAYKILAILAKRFGNSADVYDRLFPIVKYGDDVAKLVARTVEVMTNEYELEGAAVHAFKQALELTNSEMDKNTAVVEKGIATLILDMCESIPKQVIKQCGTFLVQFLSLDSAAIRSATVQGTAHLVRYLRTSEVPANRNLRGMILDEILFMHSKDVNSLVRAKCLSILVKLIEDKLLDPVETAACMKVAIERTTDSAVLPRKYAMAIINTILRHYPGICSQAVNYQAETLEQRKRLVQIMGRKAPKRSYYVFAVVREFTEQVKILEVGLPAEYEAVIEEGMDKIRQTITGFLKDEKYWECCIILYHAFQKYGEDVGIKDAGKSAAIPSMYISYFNSLAEDDGERSTLESSLDISKSMSSPDNENANFFENDEVTQCRTLLKFAQGSLKMKLLVDNLVEKLTVILQTGTEQDRTEVIRTFGELVRCGYPVNDKMTGPIIQAIATLAETSANQLVPAFCSIFIVQDRANNVQLVRNIFKILESVDSATKDLLKPIVGEMYKSESFPKTALPVLWDAFTRRFDCWSSQDAKYAIFVLGALTRHDNNILVSNIKLLMDTGLSKEAYNDMELVKLTLEALIFGLKATKKDESDIGKTYRFKPTHPIFNNLLDILVHGVTEKGNWDTHHHFPRVAELSVQIMYRLSWNHVPITNRMLLTIPAIVFGDKTREEDPPESQLKDTEEIYIRYLSIMTALLGTHINFCEAIIIPELRRRKLAAQMAVLQEAMSAIATPAQRNSLANLTAAATSHLSLNNTRGNGNGRGRGRGRTSKRQSNASTVSTSSEMEAMIGTAGFDSDLDIVKTYVEKLLDTGTFQQLRRLTLFFCQKITKIQHFKLQIVIVQAMAKLMLVSSDSVNKLVEPFIGVWTAVDNTCVKVEVLKHLAFLNVRFPNQVERCNVIIKNGLMSENKDIKTACLDLMGYLALGEMVKIRDGVAEVALCLGSDNQVVRSLARDFFDACTEKDNFISNAIPEVISQLSKREGLSQQEFQNIIKFLLLRVKKEKHILGLVETLVGKLKSPLGNVRLWEDTAYCLANLSHGEKTFKIVQSNLENYKDKFTSEKVYESFKEIATSLSKSVSKPELKAKVQDYEYEIDESRAKCVENERIEQARNRQKPRKRDSDGSTHNQSSLMEENQQGGPEPNQVPKDEPMSESEGSNDERSEHPASSEESNDEPAEDPQSKDPQSNEEDGEESEDDDD